MPTLAGRLSVRAFLSCFPLFTDEPSQVFLFHHSHPSICKSSIRDGLQSSISLLVAEKLQLDATQTQHCWWHRELSSTGTLS